MDSPASSPYFTSLSASENAAIQSVTFEQKFMAVVAPLFPAIAPEVPVCRDGDRVPIVAYPAVPISTKRKVAHTTATSSGLTTMGVSQTLSSSVAHGASPFASVPRCPEQRQPLGSLFDSFKKVVEQEKQQIVAQPVKKKPRLLPPKQSKPRPPKRQQHYQHQQYQQHSYQRQPYNYSPGEARAEFQRRIHRPFPFKREFTQEIFKSLLKRPDFLLPEPTRSDQVGRDANPNYCPYHRMLGHVLEDCVAFKEWLEKGLKAGSVVIPDEYLVDPPLRSTRAAVVHRTA